MHYIEHLVGRHRPVGLDITNARAATVATAHRSKLPLPHTPPVEGIAVIQRNCAEARTRRSKSSNSMRMSDAMCRVYVFASSAASACVKYLRNTK